MAASLHTHNKTRGDLYFLGIIIILYLNITIGPSKTTVIALVSCNHSNAPPPAVSPNATHPQVFPGIPRTAYRYSRLGTYIVVSFSVQ